MEETTMRRAQWKWVSAAMVLAGLAAAPVAAQDFPTQPVTIVVPGAAGGGGDFVGRLLAERMSQEMSQPVIVENRPGSTGNLAASSVSRATTDGPTHLLAHPGPHAPNPPWCPHPPWGPTH